MEILHCLMCVCVCVCRAAPAHAPFRCEDKIELPVFDDGEICEQFPAIQAAAINQRLRKPMEKE